jgi:cytochrome c oxidase cbb3-type subunit 3
MISLRRPLGLTLAGAVILACGAHWLHTMQMEHRLLQAAPDTIPANSVLFGFAVGHGASTYRSSCASCHGPSGKGDTTQGVPDLTDSDWLYGTGTVGDIEKVVYYGIRSHNPRGWHLAVMPAFAVPVPSPTEKIPPLTPHGIQAVTEYLLSRGGQPADRVMAMEGAAIYASSGGCYDCHTADAKGDSAIGAPNLTDSIWLYGDGGRQAIYDSIAYGRQGVCPAWTGRLSAEQMLEVSLYVYSLSHQAADRQQS